jgi:Tol biopolymer transport system component
MRRIAMLAAVVLAIAACAGDESQRDDGSTSPSLRSTPVTSTSEAGDPAGVTGVPEGRIVFAGGGINGLLDIYLYDFAVSEALNLTASVGHENYPRLSPDGGRVVFHAVPDGDLEGGNWDIFVINIDGSGLVRITTNPAGDFFPAWSPDGTRIVFEREFGVEGRDLFVINSDGTGERRLTDRPGDDVAAAWSPDGELIAFTTDRDSVPGTCTQMGAPECNTEIYVMAPDGSNPTRLTESDGIDGFPDWSPDGTRIAFHSNRADPPWNFDIYVIEADGTDPTRITFSSDSEGNPSWSPDGDFIVFSSDAAGNSEDIETPMLMNRLYLCRLDDCEPTWLEGTAMDASYPDWSR